MKIVGGIIIMKTKNSKSFMKDNMFIGTESLTTKRLF